jgi:hypothetical protein
VRQHFLTHKEHHSGSSTSVLSRLFGVNGEKVDEDARHDERESLNRAACAWSCFVSDRFKSKPKKEKTKWNVPQKSVTRRPIRSRVKTQIRLQKKIDSVAATTSRQVARRR